MSFISVIVPCYNEQESIPLFYAEISRVAELLKERFGAEIEVLFVDDGSKDATIDALRELAAGDTRVHYFSFSRNFGKEAAIYAGLRNCKGDYITLMDCDLQDPPALLPEMFQIILNGEADSVATRRVTRKGEPLIRSLFARCFYNLINKISKTEFVDGARDYRLMTRQMADAVLMLTERNRFTKGLLSWVGFKTKWMEFENVERAAGTTKWSFWGLFKYSLEGIVAFSTAPLVLCSFIGFLLCISAFIGIIWIVLRHFLGVAAAFGWSSMVVLLLLLSGLQLFSMGILGQYLAKTYLETKNRPVYIVKEER